MKHILQGLFFSLALLLSCSAADAATCYWVGGTGNYNDATHWASSSGGSASSCGATSSIPKNTGDVATFDGNAAGLNGGKATLDIALSIATINVTAMVGEFDTAGFAVTLSNQFTGTGTSTRTLTCGSSTFTFSASGQTVWDFTNTSGATINCSSATFVMGNPGATGGNQGFQGGTSKTYGTLTINSRTGGVEVAVSATTAITFGVINVNGPVRFSIPVSVTTNVTSALTLTGGPTGLVEFGSSSTNSGTPATLALSGASISASWAAIKNTTVTGGPLTGTAIFDVGGNSGVTASAPATGGKIIGG